jgi:nicotinate-nucleotide pyrophosphorylase (carboxylating)
MILDYSHKEIREAVSRALEEDIGRGDLTTGLCVKTGLKAKGRFIAREEITVAGTPLLGMIYEDQGGVDSVNLLLKEGNLAREGEMIAEVEGSAQVLLTCERVALNFLQRLSGIATLASRYVKAVSDTKTKILDTRKTTPGLRRLEKLAAAAGGAQNHRMGLYDAILIKNNHIEAAGSVQAAVIRAREAGMPIEVEVRTPEELDAALEMGVHRVLLDNLTPEEAARQVEYIGGRTVVELSGGITLHNLRDYAKAGADYISVGAITHSALAVDINFRLELLHAT